MREFRPQQLDGDVPVVLDVARQVHGGHAADAELPFDVIAATKDGGQMFERIHLSRSGDRDYVRDSKLERWDQERQTRVAGHRSPSVLHSPHSNTKPMRRIV